MRVGGGGGSVRGGGCLKVGGGGGCVRVVVGWGVSVVSGVGVVSVRVVW